MESIAKLKLLSEASDVEAGEDGCQYKSRSQLDGVILTHAVMPNGKKTTLLKSLLTSYCENNCFYCPMRSARDFRRTSFTPTEFAALAVNLTKAGLIQGVFLSSGVFGGGIRTQDRLIATAEILRKKMNYRGYIHLKIMPGADYEQILTSMRLADRVSINLEAPNAKRLPALAPKKQFDQGLMQPILIANQIRQNLPPIGTLKNRWPSMCTQFVVGGAGESDKELLETSQDLHRNQHLLRVYYSALTPHEGTPFAHHAPIPRKREQRLYQADYLIRDYGFDEQEIIYDNSGKLPLEKDPKQVWAERHLLHQPVEMNRASKEQLLRIPGIGPVGAQSVINARRIHAINDLSMLKKIGIQTARARSFILLNGCRPAHQPSLL